MEQGTWLSVTSRVYVLRRSPCCVDYRMHSSTPGTIRSYETLLLFTGCSYTSRGLRLDSQSSLLNENMLVSWMEEEEEEEEEEDRVTGVGGKGRSVYFGRLQHYLINHSLSKLVRMRAVGRYVV